MSLCAINGVPKFLFTDTVLYMSQNYVKTYDFFILKFSFFYNSVKALEYIERHGLEEDGSL